MKILPETEESQEESRGSTHDLCGKHTIVFGIDLQGFKRWLVDFDLLNQLVSGITLDELDEFTRHLHLSHLKLFQVLKLEIKTERSNMCRYTTDSKSPGLMFSLNFSRFVRSILWIEREQRKSKLFFFAIKSKQEIQELFKKTSISDLFPGSRFNFSLL